jgi:hypothetical protein
MIADPSWLDASDDTTLDHVPMRRAGPAVLHHSRVHPTTQPRDLRRWLLHLIIAFAVLTWLATCVCAAVAGYRAGTAAAAAERIVSPPPVDPATPELLLYREFAVDALPPVTRTNL